MEKIDKNIYDNADARTIAVRIDEFFKEDQYSRYGTQLALIPIVSAIEIYESETIQRFDDPDRKHAISFFYRARFQMALCHQYGATVNQRVHDSNNNKTKWLNPHIQILAASTRQASIVAARISFECLMEFVYFVENKKLIPSKNSKFKFFRKWLCAERDRFGWLVFYLLVVARYDKDHRTPEIHGTSYIAMDALYCNVWPRQDTELDVSNLNLNIWSSILATLSGCSNLSCSYTPIDAELFKDFFNWRQIDLNELWKKYHKQKQ